MVESINNKGVHLHEHHSAEGPREKIQISISCKNLADLDTFSKSDPEVHVFMKT
jgi:hypothetical protein